MKTSKVGGRAAVHVPGHPAANNRGYVLRSRYTMEQHLGRHLRRDENVHHKDGDKTNDDLSNLELLTRSEHTRRHRLDGSNPGRSRKLDYALLEQLMDQGLGYRRIAKRTGYPLYSTKHACQTIKKERGRT